MSDLNKSNGSMWKIVAGVLGIALLVGGGWYGYNAYKKAHPPAEDPLWEKTTAVVVPPEGVQSFDPKPLMDKLNETITTDKFRFGVIGDTKHALTLPALVKYLEETVKPDFMLTTGDLVRSGGGKVGPGYYELLTGELGASMRKHPWWPAIGNHEMSGNPVFVNKTEGEQLRTNQQTGTENFKRFYNLQNSYYSFTFRNCYFIALPFRYPSGSQIDWLESELKKAAEAKKHIFVFNHAPFYTVGAKGADEIPNKETKVTKLFREYGVAAVFSGHDHGFYRTVRNDVTYITSAGGGAKLYEGLRIKEALPGDAYYYGVPGTFSNGKKNQFVLHKSDGSPEIVSTVPDQFVCVVDVDGDKITCTTTSVKGEKWDEIILSK